jgi:hypothetical protein
MSNPTSYLVMVAGVEVDRKSKKATAIEKAIALRAENPSDTIEVQTGAGNVVHTVPVKGTHAKPWTRVQEHNLTDITVPAGYEVSYVRARVGALVCRAQDKSGLLVVTKDETFEAKNTIEAREITNKLAADYAAKREAEKAELRKEVEDRKAARAKAAQEKRDAAAKAKAEKAAQKEAEKAAKEAEAAEEEASEEVAEPVSA